MRFALIIIMNVYIYFASFAALLDIWGWIWTLLLVITGPAFIFLAPLLVWLLGGDSSLILLVVFGNLALWIIAIGPAVLEYSLPKNQLVNTLRIIVNSIFALVVISQGISLLSVIFASILFESEMLVLITVYGGGIIGGIYGAWYFLNLTEDSVFEMMTSKRMLFTVAIVTNVIMLLGNLGLDNGGAGVYSVNSLTCLLACIYFINISDIEPSHNKIDNT